MDGASHISARPERVLLVDDDQDILRFIEMLMRREGFGDTGLGVSGEGYITKPFDPDDFVHVVDGILAGTSERREGLADRRRASE